MSSEFVALVKEASDAIQRKEYPAVIASAESALAVSLKENLTGKKLETRAKELCNVHLMLGVAFFNLHELNKAEEAYRKAQAHDPQNKDPWQGLIQIYTQRNEKAQLVDALKSLIALVPKGVKRWISLVSDLAIEMTPREAKPFWQSILDSLVSEHKSVDAEFKQYSQTLARACILELETDDERKEQLEIRTTRQLEKIRKEKMDKAAEEKRKGISKDLKSTEASRKQEDATVQDEEADIRRRVANKYEQTLLARTELDELYRTLYKHPLTVSADRFFNSLIVRSIARIRLANTQEEADACQQVAIQECRDMLSKYPTSAFAAEVLMALFATIEYPAATGKTAVEQKALSEQFPSLWISALVKAIEVMTTSKKADSLSLLTQMPSEPPGPGSVLYLPFVSGLCTRARCEVALGHFMAVKTTTERAQSLILTLRTWYPFRTERADRLERDVQMCLARADAGEGKDQRLVDLSLERFRALSSKVVDADEQEQVFRGIAECALMKLVPDRAEADRACRALLERQPKNAWALSLRGWLNYCKDPTDREALLEAVDLISQALKEEPLEAQHSLRLGKVYWQLGGEYKFEPQYALKMFQAASASNPQWSEPFAMLGDYFASTQDEKQAREQYEKALSLDKSCKEAGVALFEIYASSNQLVRARAMCERALKSNSRSHWAWVRLGRIRRADKLFSEAAIAFQNALRLDGEDALSWEELGECYIQQGKFTPALACFTRACEISETEVRLYLKASAHSSLDQQAEALEILLKMSQQSDETVFVPALKLLAEVSFREAQSLLLSGAFHTCITQLHACKAVVLRCSALLERTEQKFQAPAQLTCLHKLLGDTLALFAYLPESDKLKHLLEADAAYAKLAELSPSSASFYDRGVNYFQIAMIDRTNQQDFYLKANDCFKSALELEANSPLLWIAFGVTSTRPQVRQHCFIQALELNSKSAEAWCSLAFLYMQHGNWMHARQAFEKAQSCDPMNPELWYGQGLFNQQIGTTAAFNHAGAAFRRSIELRASKQARLGLGYMAYLGGDIEEAAFSLRKCVEQDVTIAVAHNLLGLALEQRAQYLQAIQAFARGEELLERLKGDREQLDGVKLNRARALTANGQYEAACTIYQSLQVSSGEVHAALAHAQLHLGRKDQAVKACKLAFESPDFKVDEARRELLLDLARAHWAFKDRESAQKCLRQHPELIDGKVLTLDCVLALRAGDVDGASKILAEMSSQPNFNADDWHHLRAQEALARGDEVCARRHLAYRLRSDPTKVGCWNDLAHLVQCSGPVSAITSGTHNPLPPPSSNDISSLQLLSAAYRVQGGMQGSLPPAVDALDEDEPDIVQNEEDKEDYDAISESEEKKVRFGRVRVEVPRVEVPKTPNSWALRLLRADPFSVEGWLEVGLNCHARALESCDTDDLDKHLRALELAVTVLRDNRSPQLVLLLVCLAECQLLRNGTASPELLGEIAQAATSAPLQAAVKRLHGRAVTLGVLREAVRADSNSALAWEALAARYCDSQNPLAGELCLKTALQVASKTIGDHGIWRIHLRLAKLYYFSKRYVPGLEAANQALACLERLGVTSSTALCLQGLFFRKSRKWKEAEACFSAVLKYHEQAKLRLARPLLASDEAARAIALLNLGSIQAKDNRLAEAESSFQQARCLAPMSPAVYYQMGTRSGLCKALHLNPACQTFWAELAKTSSVADKKLES